MINEKTRLEIEYLKMKKRLYDFKKEEKSEKHKQFKLLDVFIESVQNTFNSIVISSSLSRRSFLTHLYLVIKKISILRMIVN